MTPTNAAFDSANYRSSDAVIVGNVFLHSSVGSYSPNLKFCEFCRPASFAAITSSVASAIHLVARFCVPSKVRKFVVRCVAIVMTTFHPFGTWAYKSFQNKPVNSTKFLFVVPPKLHAEMTVHSEWNKFFYASFNNFCGPMIVCQNFMVQAFYSTKIRNLINSLVANNRFPYFIHVSSQPLDTEVYHGECC